MKLQKQEYKVPIGLNQASFHSALHQVNQTKSILERMAEMYKELTHRSLTMDTLKRLVSLEETSEVPQDILDEKMGYVFPEGLKTNKQQYRNLYLGAPPVYDSLCELITAQGPFVEPHLNAFTLGDSIQRSITSKKKCGCIPRMR